MLDMAESSIRRWCKTLDDSGYEFYRKGKVRQLLDRDLSTLSDLKRLSQDMTIEDACEKIVHHSSKEWTAIREIMMIFDDRIKTLKDDVYWQGPQAIDHIMECWNEVKSRVDI